MTLPILQTRSLSVSYGSSRALTKVDIEVPRGSLVAVAGSNGAGKSTLVNAIAGWFRSQATITGTVLYNGNDISAVPPHLRVRDGVVLTPEGRGVFSNLTVAENLNLVARPADPEAKERVFSDEAIFELFPNLKDRTHARAITLSGGERQMLAVSRALRAGPDVLMLDEPSVGLAPRVVADLLLRIRGLVDAGLSVLLVEQNVRAALDVADYLYLLERGTVVGAGTAGEMRNDRRIVESYLGTVAK